MEGGSDREAVAREFVARRSELFAFILSLAPDFDFAGKALQEAGVAVCRRAKELIPGTPFGPWARGIARETVRRLGGAEIALSPAAIAALDRAFESPGAPIEVLKQCLESAGPHARSLLSMRYQRCLGGEDISRRCKTPAGKIFRALSRARVALARCVGGRSR